MLSRSRVRGFKNLLDLDVRFVPFTCIAGANGVGKSNLFDQGTKSISDIHCAKKLGKRGSNVRNISETFCRNPAGNQSRLVELGRAARSESCIRWGGTRVEA